MAAWKYRSVGKAGEPWPDWVRELRGKSGVYAIREGRLLVYIGESHGGRLYDTITRHFQTWKRSAKGARRKSFMSWFFGSARDADPGYTYDRGACVVAVEVTRAWRATSLQYARIRRLKPRDNQVRGDGGDDAPF